MFALGIFLEESQGQGSRLHVETDNLGLREEVTLTMVRNWLRKADDKFKAEA